MYEKRNLPEGLPERSVGGPVGLLSLRLIAKVHCSSKHMRIFLVSLFSTVYRHIHIDVVKFNISLRQQSSQIECLIFDCGFE